MLYTYINRHAGTPDKNKTKTFLVHNKNRFIIIYSNSAIDPYTIRAYSLEHKQCYNIVIDKGKYIRILQQGRREHIVRGATSIAALLGKRRPEAKVLFEKGSYDVRMHRMFVGWFGT